MEALVVEPGDHFADVLVESGTGAVVIPGIPVGAHSEGREPEETFAVRCDERKQLDEPLRTLIDPVALLIWGQVDEPEVVESRTDTGRDGQRRSQEPKLVVATEILADVEVVD